MTSKLLVRGATLVLGIVSLLLAFVAFFLVPGRLDGIHVADTVLYLVAGCLLMYWNSRLSTSSDLARVKGFYQSPQGLVCGVAIAILGISLLVFDWRV